MVVRRAAAGHVRGVAGADDGALPRIAFAFLRRAHQRSHRVFDRTAVAGASLRPGDSDPDGPAGCRLERIAEDRLGRPSVSVAGSEILVFQPPAYAMRQLVWLDRSGRRVGVLGDPAIQAGFDVDAAGTIAAVERLTDDGEHLWLIDGTRGVTTRVDERDVASSPVLSEDGQRLMHLAQRQGHSSIVERSVRGGATRVVFDYRGEGVLYLADRSRDGRYALVGKAERNGRAALIAPVDGGEPTLVAQGIQLGGARLSPDGRWLAYVMARTSQPQVFVAPLPATGDEWQVSSAGGNMPHGVATAVSSSTSLPTD